jgi:hypothetical protein
VLYPNRDSDEAVKAVRHEDVFEGRSNEQGDDH